MGIATAGRGIDTPEQLLKQADLALYQAKRDGRNRVVAAAA
jgi:two-component system cell cycle response regulator